MNDDNTSCARLGRDAYDELRKAVLKRDGWKCQGCGARCRLEVHHIRFRSRQGRDRKENLITLCNQCHAGIHGRK